MKKFLLSIVCLLSALYMHGQNTAPVAVNDTLSYSYNSVHLSGLDSLHIMYKKYLENSYDPDGDSIFLSSVSILSTNGLDYFSTPANGVILTFYQPNTSFVGWDSIQFVVRDNGSPILYDTAILYIFIEQKGHASIETSVLKATFDKESLFYKGGNSGLEYPKNSEKHTLYAANLMVSGLNNGVVHNSFRTYTYEQDPFFIPSNNGPIGNVVDYHNTYSTKWDRVWRITQNDISYHTTHYQDVGYQPIEPISSWPAHGDIAQGEADFLAPFVDVDNNGMYEPLQGDYPSIKGDQSIFFIYNDLGSNYLTQPMHIEFHGMAYTFFCNDDALKNTVFVDYKIINRSSTDYDSTYIGLFVDPDVGFAFNDFFRTDVMRNALIGYTASNFDDVYGTDGPVQGVTLLKGIEQPADGIDNAFGIGPNESVNGIGFGDGIADNEIRGMEFTSNMQLYSPVNNTNCRDALLNRYNGAPLMVADSTGSPVALKFLFTGSSDPYHYATGGVPYPELTQEIALNQPNDIKMALTTGGYTFKAGSTLELQYAFVIGHDSSNAGFTPAVDVLNNRIDSIRSYVQNGTLSPCGFPSSVTDAAFMNTDIQLFPNPAKEYIHIKNNSAQKATFRLYNIQGVLIKTGVLDLQQNSISVQDLPVGTYYLQWTNGSQSGVAPFTKM